MKKINRKTPKETIESVLNPKVENAFIKFPGKELSNVSLESSDEMVYFDLDKMKRLWLENNKKKFSKIHTHVYNPDIFYKTKIGKGSPLPSYDDLKNFLIDDYCKSMIIAQQNNKTGEADGSFVIGKTKKTKSFGLSSIESYETTCEKYPGFKGLMKKLSLILKIILLESEIIDFHHCRSLAYKFQEPNYLSGAINKISENFKLRYRFFPAKGYTLDANGMKFIKMLD